MNKTAKQQVTSLELSKKLKELGVKQESLFYWVNDGVGSDGWSLCFESYVFVIGREEFYRLSAFTVAELGEMLPDTILGINGGIASLEIFKFALSSDGWEISYSESAERCTAGPMKAETEADVRAKMLIYLIENKFVAL